MQQAPFVRRVLVGLGGAVAGALVASVVHLALPHVMQDEPAVANRLPLAARAVYVWLVLAGVAVALFGRVALAAVESRLLPDGTGAGGRALFRIAGLVALLAEAHYHMAHFLLRVPVDLPTFLLAAQAIAQGLDPYDPQVLAGLAGAAAPDGRVLPYLYPPLFAVLLRPLAALPFWTATAAFLLANGALWPLLVYLSLRLVDPPEHLRAPLLALILMLLVSFLPAIQTMHHGSPSLLVAVLVVGALVAERRGRSHVAGALLSLAVLIKVVPILVVGYLLLRRRLRAVVATAVAAVALVGVSLVGAGLEPHVRWISRLAPGLVYGASSGSWFEPSCHIENQSIVGVVCRALPDGSGIARPLGAALSVLLVLAAAGALVRRSRGRGIDGLEASLVLVTLLLASSITWFHHMTLMLPPLLALCVAAAGARRHRLLLGAAALLALVAIGFEYLYDPWPFVGPSEWTHSLRFAAMAASFLCLLVLVGRRVSQPDDQTGDEPEVVVVQEGAGVL